jgi:hypothetical protein
VGPSEPISEAAHKRFSDLFQGPLAAKSIDALRAATRLGDAEVSRVDLRWPRTRWQHR